MSFKPYFPEGHMVLTLGEAASQTFTAGDLVYLNAGLVTECGADPSLIYGVAARAGQNTSGATTQVYPILPGTVWIAESNTTTAVAHQGGQYGVVDDSGPWRVDISETTNKRVNIVKLADEDAVGDSNGRYLVTFVDKNLQLSGGNY